MMVSSVRAWLSILMMFVVLNGIVPMSALGLERADKQDSFLDHQGLFEPAWAMLLEALPAGTRFRTISIEDKRISVEISTDGVRLQRSSVSRERFLGLFDRIVVEALQPVYSGDSGFEASLFAAEDIALDKLDDLVDGAIRRAGLEDPARVTGIEIGSPLIVLPSPHFGRLRITLSVNSGYESARVFAEPDGTIVAADLSQTRRAARLNLLTMDDWPMEEAQASLAAAAGPGAVIREVNVSRSDVTLKRDNPSNPAAADFVSWDLSGALVNGIPTRNPAGPREYLPFTLDEVDLTALPAVKKTALEAFGAPDVAITDITAKKSLGPTGLAGSEVLWHVQAQFPGTPDSPFGIFPDLDELGTALVRTDGTLVQVILPKRMRPPIDWLSGDGLVLALNAIRETYGDEALIQEVSVSYEGARIFMEDPDAPGKTVTLNYTDAGLEMAFIQSGSATFMEDAYTISDLDPPGIEGIAALVQETFEKAGADPAASTDKRLYSLKLYGSNGQLTPAGSPQLEIRAPGSIWMTYRFATGEFVPEIEQMRSF